jgi:hypothetical protein
MFLQGLDHFISLPLGFFTFALGFRILGAPMGSTSFVQSFVVEVFHEDLGTISNLPMFINLHVVFLMFSLCYTQRSGYLFCTMFPSLGILQHYVEFNTCTIVTLEKLFGVKSFGGYIGHLVCCQTTLITFSGKLGLPFVVQIVALAFFGCWALIIPTLVICF